MVDSVARLAGYGSQGQEGSMWWGQLWVRVKGIVGKKRVKTAVFAIHFPTRNSTLLAIFFKNKLIYFLSNFRMETFYEKRTD